MNILKEKMIVLPLVTFNRLESTIEKLESNINLLNERLQISPSILQTIQNSFDSKNKFCQNNEVKFCYGFINFFSFKLLNLENEFEMEETTKKPRLRSQTNKKKDTNAVFKNLK